MNELQFESSPYLLQHKDNPVDWKAWSLDSLDYAKSNNKPILISIGYSTCHWCHVMAHESFEDAETARIMNEYFVNIKIDREERPDLDHYFMNAVQAMGVSGGWPLHCFLTSDGKPFFGGTYFPPIPKYGRPSWKQILLGVHHAIHDKPDEIAEQAFKLFEHLQFENEIVKSNNIELQEINADAILTKLSSSFDHINGGFGTYPKFPNTQAIQLLFHLFFLKGSRDPLVHALFSLKRMCLGGIYDHIEGGLCRYSVDANWNVPHFEKMLYDHARFIETLSIAFQLNKSTFTKFILLQSIDFFERRMQDQSGLFYSAMDADSEGQEGTFYVWTEKELKELLQDYYSSFSLFFTWNHLEVTHIDKKVIRLKTEIQNDQPLIEYLQSPENGLNLLREFRNKRTLPSRDDKMIVSWNAMLASAYLSWYKVSLDKSFLLKAEALINAILKVCCKSNHELCRYYIKEQSRGFGFLEDYAYLIKALLDLFGCTQRIDYFNHAVQFFNYVDTNFGSKNSVIYNVSPLDLVDFKIEQKNWADSTYPNPNAVLSWCCRYFYEFTFNEKYLRISESLLNAIRNVACAHPLSMASWTQQLLNEEFGYITLHTRNHEKAFEILRDIFIPCLIIIPETTDTSGLIFCFNEVCHKPVHNHEEVLSLFSKYHTQLAEH